MGTPRREPSGRSARNGHDAFADLRAAIEDVHRGVMHKRAMDRLYTALDPGSEPLPYTEEDRMLDDYRPPPQPWLGHPPERAERFDRLYARLAELEAEAEAEAREQASPERLERGEE